MPASSAASKLHLSHRAANTINRSASTSGASWRLFAGAIAGLALSFFLALCATAAGEHGHPGGAATLAGLSLLLAGAVAVRVVPDLARRSSLRGWVFKVEYELTREGLIYFIMIVLIATASLNTGNNLLFVILAILLAGILLSGFLSKLVLSNLELDLGLPEHIFAQQPVLALLTLANLKQFFPTYSVTVTSRPGNASELGRARTRQASTPPEAILRKAVYTPYVPAQSSVTQQIALTFPRRGRYGQESFLVSSKFPFGILRRKRFVPSRREILILPSIQPTPQFHDVIPLIDGEVEILRKGRGDDFYALRDYQEGDSARHVDWKASAKSEKLKVREFAREEESRLTLVFDHRLTELTAERLNSFEKAVALCACVAWRFCEAGAFLQFISENLVTPMAPAASIIYPALETLAAIEPQVRAASSCDGFLARVSNSIAGFPIIFTDQPRGAGLQELRKDARVIAMDSL